MTPENVQECIKVLQRERKRIVEQLEHPDLPSSERFHTLSLFLRNLLVGEFPVLLKFADHVGCPLNVWAPRGIPDGYLVGTNFHIASWARDEPGVITTLYATPVAAFLKIVVHIEQKLGGEPVRVTPEMVIKWVANKEGNAHLDFKKPAGLVAAKSWITETGDVRDDATLLRRYLIQMSIWSVNAIDHVLRHSGALPDRPSA